MQPPPVEPGMASSTLIDPYELSTVTSIRYSSTPQSHIRLAPGVAVVVASKPTGARNSATTAVVGEVRTTTPFFVTPPSDGNDTGESVYSA